MDGITIRRLVTAPEVEHREPVAPSSVFGVDEERVYAFIEVSNESEDDKTLLVHFIGPDGQVSGGIELDIPASAPRWRTWAHTRHANEARPVARRDPKHGRSAARGAAVRGRARSLGRNAAT